MVPLGYCTLRELEQLAIHDELERAKPTPKGQHLWNLKDSVVETIVKMIFSAELPLFVERNGTVYRVPPEDIVQLYDYLPEAVWTGYFVKEPTAEDIEEEAKDRAEDPSTEAHYSEIADWLSDNPEMKVYCGARPLVKEEHLKVLFPPKVPGPRRKSGAPGRPTSMDLILAEHRRRDDAGEAGPTRQAEARALEGWLLKTHSTDAAPARWKSILNKLPRSFQPRNGRLTK